MSTSNVSKLSMKVVMNKEKSKELFAEADSVVVDVLLSFRTLPLGKIVRILDKHYGDEAPVFGSLTTLYRGLSNLDSTHFSVEGAKQMLLHPATSFQDHCRRLKLDISDSQHRKLYYCEGLKCSDYAARNVSLYSDIGRCFCGRPLKREGSVVVWGSDYVDGVFMMREVSFIISDDLRIAPVVPNFLKTLTDLGIADTDGAEMRILEIDLHDVMDLFKLSLVSSTPLTDLVIKKAQKNSFSTMAKPSPCFSHRIPNEDANSRNMILKVFLQKSTNKFLLAVANDEFVEFLFSFLVVPLGGVEYLLEGKTCLNNVDNLYSSLTDLIDDKYFMSSYTKKRLMNPELPYGYVLKSQILPFTAEAAPDGQYLEGVPLSFEAMKQKKRFVKEETTYVVRDDLTVTPFSMTSCVSICNSLGISLSDVTEMDLQIGVEEALRILKASLSSATPLTDVLINPMLNKLPKRPKLEP